jgi:hypothetical protein
VAARIDCMLVEGDGELHEECGQFT